MMERHVWLTVAAIGLICSILYGGRLYGVEDRRTEKCAMWANFAVTLRSDMKDGGIVNVMPSMEAFKAMVADFKGTDAELKAHVMNDCMGVRT